MRQDLRVGLATLASVAACLVVLELALAVVARAPSGGDPAKAGALARYFDYGRSIEGKVRPMLGLDGGVPGPLAQVGWIAPPADQPHSAGEGQDLLIAGYGMSFAANILRRMREQDPRIAVRFVGGPGATLSHSYALHRADRGHHQARVVVLGVLASSLPGLVTISHMTWNFEAPSPHFYPRFTVADGRLAEHVPLIRSLGELQAAARDPARWRALTAEIAAQDEFYDPLVFHAWGVDESALARLARRGWGQRAKRATIARFHDERGFTNEAGLIDVTQALVRSFVDRVRGDGQLPVVVAINDRGYDDHLHRVLAPIVAGSGAVYFSTHELAPPSHGANFVKDGHFVAAKDEAFARALGDLINSRLGRQVAAVQR